MIYEIGLPVALEVLQDPRFSFQHPDLFNPISNSFNTKPNSHRVPSTSYVISIPEGYEILAPENSIVRKVSYKEDFPTHDNRLAHMYNYALLELENDGPLIKIDHIKPSIKAGETISKKQVIGHSFGYFGENPITDAHIHLTIRRGKMHITDLPKGWEDKKRNFVERCISIICLSEEERRNLEHNHGKKAQIKQATFSWLEDRLN